MSHLETPERLSRAATDALDAPGHATRVQQFIKQRRGPDDTRTGHADLPIITQDPHIVARKKRL
jgi:hypothetical protein